MQETGLRAFVAMGLLESDWKHVWRRQLAELRGEIVKGNDDRLGLEPWHVFREGAAENPNYLVDGMVIEGTLGFIGGAPKAGKTWIGAELAVSVATQTKFLEHFNVQRAQPVIYFGLEGHRSALRTRFGAIARNHGFDPDENDSALSNLILSYKPLGFDLMDPEWASDVAEGVLGTDARLVVVDVLRAAAPRLREGGEGSIDFALIRTHLAPILAAGVTVMLCHHEIKPGDASKGREAGQKLSGSGALYGALDVLLAVHSKPDNRQALRIDHVLRDDISHDPFGVFMSGPMTGEFGGWRYADTIRMSFGRDVPEGLR